MAWLKENQDTLAQGYDFIRSIIANRGVLPPITSDAAATVPGGSAAGNPLPPINE